MSSNDKPGEDQIKEQLDRMLAFPEFAASRILSAFLRFVVEETLQGRAEEIKEYTIAIHVLGRKKDFDPKLDSVVRIHAGRLRRTLHDYYEGPGFGDPVLIGMPKGAYVPVFEAVEAGTASAPAMDKPSDDLKTLPPLKHSIAVLPFRNLSEDASQDFFAQGLCVQLSAELTRFRELAVISCYSSARIADSLVDVRSIGKELGASYLLSGAVRRSKDRVRIQVDLKRTDTGLQLWAQSYDRILSAGHLFDIEDEIVHSVASVIGGMYGVIIREAAKSSGRTRMAKIETYDAVLWYYYYQLEHNQKSFYKARTALERAVRIDPGYAHAWAVLGEMYLGSVVLGFSGVEDAINKGLKCAREAIKHDPEGHSGYQTLANAHLLLKQREAFVQATEKCLALNPHEAFAIGFAAFGFACAGLYPRAMELFAEATRLNPHHPWWFNTVPCFSHYHNRAYEEALKYAEKMNKPDSFWDPLLRAAALGQLQRTEEARYPLEELNGLDPEISRNAPRYLNALLMSGDLVEHIVEGLRKAGMTML